MNDSKAKYDEIFKMPLGIREYIVEKFIEADPTLSKKELVEIGTHGLIKGIENYNSESNQRPSVVFARTIEDEILMYLRMRNTHTGEEQNTDTHIHK